MSELENGRKKREYKLDRSKTGRAKGTPNRATAQAREAIARFVDGNADRLNGWLDEIEAKDGAKAAFNCFTALIEYHVPKLGRTEHVGEDGGPIQARVEVQFVCDAKSSDS